MKGQILDHVTFRGQEPVYNDCKSEILDIEKMTCFYAHSQAINSIIHNPFFIFPASLHLFSSYSSVFHTLLTHLL